MTKIDELEGEVLERAVTRSIGYACWQYVGESETSYEILSPEESAVLCYPSVVKDLNASVVETWPEEAKFYRRTKYTKDIARAWELIEAMQEADSDLHVELNNGQRERDDAGEWLPWNCELVSADNQRHRASGTTVSVAICRAFLKIKASKES